MLFRFSLTLYLSISIQGLSQPAEPLFSLLEASFTNVHFANNVIDKGASDIFHEQNYYNGGGVAMGDVNNDGLLDLFLTGNQVADKLYLNLGSMVFKDITKEAGIMDDGNWSTGVTMADVNSDGLLDIYVSRDILGNKNNNKNSNKLYINQGNLKFVEQAERVGLANRSGSVHAVFFDYDNDGDLDAFLVNHPPNPWYFGDRTIRHDLDSAYCSRLYENTDGGFVDISMKTGVLTFGFLLNALATDLNNDGWIDIYTSGDFITPDYMYINQKDGTFKNVIHESVKHTSYSSMGADAADIDNDGLLDIMTVDMVAEDNRRLKSNMSGMDPSKFWNTVNSGGHFQYMFNTLQWNRGMDQSDNLCFSEVAQLAGVATTDWSWGPLFADFDNDGYKDIFVTNGYRIDCRNTDAIHKMTEYSISKFEAYKKNTPQGSGNFEVWSVLDFNEVMELYPSEKLENYMYKNTGGIRFEKVNKEWGFEQGTFSNGAAYGDLDNDGDLDLVVNNINDPVFIYQNNLEGNDANFLKVELTREDGKTTMGSKIEIEYVNDEGVKRQYFELSNARGFQSSSQQIAHFGLGETTVVSELKVNWLDGTVTLLENVQANQYLRIKKTGALRPLKNKESNFLFSEITDQIGIDYLHRESDYDDFSKEILLPHKMSTLGPCFTVGDINNDGLEDIFIGGAAGESGVFFLQQANGKFLKRPFDADKILEDTGCLLFDADQDGDLDLYVVSGSNEFKASFGYIDRLYLNHGEGSFTRSFVSLPPKGISGSVVKSFDYNDDGLTDLFVGGRQVPGKYPSPASSYILENKGLNEDNLPVFTEVTSEVAPFLEMLGMVTDAVCTDIDADGSTDLLIVGEWMHPMVLLNKKGKFENATINSGLEEYVGWWFSAESADFDNDGDQDFVLGNLGLNYKYKAGKAEPFDVHYKDFDQNGTGDIVLSYYNFGEKYPLRGRSCSSNQIASLKGKFPDYTSFSIANLGEVYGVQALSSALHYSATEFASVYLENLGNGKFSVAHLPLEAQVSAVQDMIVKDFNGDGNADVILAGGLYDAEVETARNDAGVGLLLFGDGKGKFESVTPSKSGIYMYSNVKGLIDLKWKEQELLISISNSSGLSIYQQPETE